MEKKKSILSSSLLAGALIAVSGLTANANGLFNYNALGTGEMVRTTLSVKGESAKNLDLKCGAKCKSDTTKPKKGKDGKCGEGKCGATKTTKKKG